MKRRRRLDTGALLAVGAAVALVAFYWAAVALSEEYYLVEAPPGSVFSSADDGLKILSAYLDEIQVTQRTLQQFETLPERGTIVIAASQPLVKQPTRSEVRRLRAWIEAGGRLVLVGPQADVLGGSLGGSITAGEDRAHLTPRLPALWTDGVNDVVIGSERILVNSPVWATHLKDGGGQALVSRAVGEGEVVWLASLLPAANAGIGEEDNARLVTSLVALRQPVYFDEYHHGFVKGRGLWQRLGASGQAAALLAALAIGIALAAASRRLGPAIEPLPERSARGSAYIGSLAELYRKAGARQAALGSLADGLKDALTRRYGNVDVGLARHPGAASALGEAARAATADIDDDMLVRIARALAQARQEVEGRHG